MDLPSYNLTVLNDSINLTPALIYRQILNSSPRAVGFGIGAQKNEDEMMRR